MGGSPSPTCSRFWALLGCSAPLKNKLTGGEIITKNTENLAIIYDDVLISTGSIATKTAITAASKIDAARLQGFRVMKVEYWMDFYGKTTAEGPIMFGWTPTKTANSVGSAIEADPQSQPDTVGNEEAKAPVFPLEMIDRISVANGPNFPSFKGSFNPRWSTPEGHAVLWWLYNLGSGAVTSFSVHIFAKYYGVWLRD